MPQESVGSDVVVEGLEQPLLDEEAEETTASSHRGERSVQLPADSSDKRSLYGSRSITRIRSNAGRIRSVRSLGLQDANGEGDVAFKIMVTSQTYGDRKYDENGVETPRYVDIDVCHDTVSEAIQGAVETAVQEVVQDAVQGAVQDAVQQVIDDSTFKFDVRANVYTLIAITGVIIFWRGIWTTWDYFFGFVLWSELGAIATGLVIMITFRLVGVPLLDGLPSG